MIIIIRNVSLAANQHIDLLSIFYFTLFKLIGLHWHHPSNWVATNHSEHKAILLNVQVVINVMLVNEDLI